MTKTLGICFGASTIQCLMLLNDSASQTTIYFDRITHEGNPKKALFDHLSSLNLSEIDKIAVTGRNFRKNVNLTSISEAEALEYALKAEYPDGDFPDLVISSGGETQLIYKIGQKGNIISVHSGNKCASGTGEFFLQQIGRMNLTIEEAIQFACSGTPHKIAGRCSVFCKSDCTHALNKGEPKENIAAGLCTMMADKVFEIIKDMKCEKALFIGGGTLNQALVDILRQRLPKVDIPKFAAAFEAYGTALWANKHPCKILPDNLENITTKATSSFEFYPPLSQSASLVTFKESQRISLNDADICLLGLDVGSTTTKAVLMHKDKEKIAASVYVRTNGNPVEASKQCYAAIREQIQNTPISIVGLGVTGSGRQIAALHALTDCIINEIIAHATAAAYFDPEVDTIFEIGGQDAKYTYLSGSIPSDYAMNEACSAGTGSFLEESAKESLNVLTEMIGALALQGKTPPNFTDQCAAFISSDIKRASQENIGKNDILAGLVYSICLNYLNRVKKSRPIGKKIFMQGGVCYNKAVPIAMAALIQTPIIVPPDPGLMGAFGIALELKKQQKLGLIKQTSIDLDELINRQAENIGSFTCGGGKEKCDRKCEISRIKIHDEIYPFGGACDLYYNKRLGKSSNASEFDYVAIRQNLLFKKYLDFVMPSNEPSPYSVIPEGESCEPIRNPLVKIQKNQPQKTIGIMRSFLTHSLAILYSEFFHELGFKVIISDEIDPAGIARIEAAFCLPVELSHGNFLNLINQNLDYIFLPHILELPTPHKTETFSKPCVFVQGEPYYLKTTFRNEIAVSKTKLFSPTLKMTNGYEEAEKSFISITKELSITKKQAKNAFKKAIEKQKQFEKELLDYGKKALTYLDAHPDTFGIILLGRPYNAFASEANMGIPHKVASRNVMIIPLDMLPIDRYSVDKKIYWAMGQKIMLAAKMIKERENLFSFYITNFSCGPDSFVLGYFRDCMGNKPSLTLELDQHTADAGIDTRIEAALDIMCTHRTTLAVTHKKTTDKFTPAYVKYGKKPIIVASNGKQYSLQSNQVEMVFPSMGKRSTQAIAALFKEHNITSHALPIPNKNILLEGKKNTLCKECLPYILTTGSFMSYLKTKKDSSKVTLLFMPTGEGPCRLGQYCKALDQVIIKNKIPNVAVFSLTDENGYAGLGSSILMRAWQGIILSDTFNDIHSMLSVTAKNKKQALKELDDIWQQEVLRFLEGRHSKSLSKALFNVSKCLSKIPLKQDPRTVPVISLTGEIFVRQEEFSRKNIVTYLEDHGFMVKVAPIAEYVCYSNYLINKNLGLRKMPFGEKMKTKIATKLQKHWESRIKSILAKSGLYKFELIEVEKTMKKANHLIDEKLHGESILTVGLALREILHDSCGVISIGPFGCMPSRIAESILRKEMNSAGKNRAQKCGEKTNALEQIGDFPYLSLETDGNPYPQMIEANLEAFILQAKRIHEAMMGFRKQKAEGQKPAI